MKLFLAFISFFGFANLAANAHIHFDNVQYVDNYDGDTFTANIPNVHPLLGERIKVRLRGVDTPELNSDNHCEKKLARQAEIMLWQLLSSAKVIDLKYCERGNFFRIVCRVYADGHDVSEPLIKNKLGVLYFGGKKNKIDWCKKG